MTDNADIRWLPRAVLFCDTTGSTALYDRAGDRVAVSHMRKMLAALADTATHNGGRVVKTMGDGLMAEFADTAAGVAAGCAMQRAAVALQSSRQVALPLRIGIDVGQVGLAAERDIFGATVNLAARLLGVAGPGELVVTERVLAELPKPHPWASQFLGEKALKGIAEKVPCHRIDWQDSSKTDARPCSRLHLHCGDGRRLTFAEHDSPVTLGRRYDVDCPVDHPLVSPVHLEFLWRTPDWKVRVTGLNGAFLKEDKRRHLPWKTQENLPGEGSIDLGAAGTEIVFAVETPAHSQASGNWDGAASHPTSAASI